MAVYLLVNTHALSATFLISLGVYHLIVVPKNSTWWKVSASVIVAVLLFSPYIAILISGGIDRSIIDWLDQSADGWQAVGSWLAVSFEQSASASAAICGRSGARRLAKTAGYPAIFLAANSLHNLVLGIFAQLTPFIAVSGMRHQLPGWFALVLVFAAGLYAFYLSRRWLAILVILWMVSGQSFQMTADWNQIIAGRAHAFSEPVWHVISRTLSERDDGNPVFGYSVPTYRISHPRHVGYSQREYFFDQKGIDLHVVNESVALDLFIQGFAITVPEYWVIYQTGDTEEDRASEIQAIASAWRYAACETIEAGVNTVLERYRWQTLGCEPRPESASNKNELIDYKFYAAQVDSSGARVFFVDEWSALIEGSFDNYRMSYQLISTDWNNVAQLDLPLLHEGQIRQFSIDVSGVPQGSYRLMAVLYDKLSGKRVAWTDSGANPPELLPLAEIVLE